MKENHSELTVVRYTPDKAGEWDRFVESSRNGTFLHERGYMDYHADRFADHSLFFYRGEKIVAALPAHVKEKKFCSHNGLTYGGLILPGSTTTGTVLEIFDALRAYIIAETDAETLIYKPTPYIYHRYPCEEDLYALFRNNAQLTECKVSSVIKLDNPLPFQGHRKLTNAAKSRLNIVEEGDFKAFWKILEERLQSKYGVHPVHSIDEILLLKERFPANIRLFCITGSDNGILGGVVLFITDSAVHMQYSATTEEGRRVSALDMLYEHIIGECFTDRRFFDFGISVEDGGRFLNSGLIAYKERLGGRAVVYNTYEIKIREGKE